MVSDSKLLAGIGEGAGGVADPVIVVVLPALNEEEGIGGVLEGIRTCLSAMRHEVLVVDGGSTDGTVHLARLKGAHVIFQRGEGYGDALISGFSHAFQAMNADVLVTMDADASYDPRDIPAVTSPLREGEADLAVGNRFPRMDSGAMSWLNKLGNRVLSWLARGALRVSVYDTQSGFKAFSRELYSCMDLSSEGMPLSTQVLGEARRAGARIAEVPVAYRPRAGKRKLNPLRDGLNILTTILMLARDYRPLAF
ncbi:MAG: glycosyltransferase family 2 protein, partial [Thermoplasmata archaeon]